jgi:flagellar biosynthesis/type III secretory pathway protein FliH
MMSLSRVIKGTTKDKQLVSDYFFETLQTDGLSMLSEDVESFQPLFTVFPDSVRVSKQPDSSGRFPEERLAGDNPGPGAKELKRLLQEACDRGFADGRREAEESFAGICRALSEAIIAVSGLRMKIFRDCEDDLLRLAMTVSKQIVRQEISQDRTILAQFVCDATAGITDHNDITISFNPEDYRVVSANKQLYLAGIGDKMNITIKPDDSVTVGGCVADTQTSLVDARVETQLAEIFKRLMDERGNGCDGSLGLPAEAELYQAKQCGVENYGYQKD